MLTCPPKLLWLICAVIGLYMFQEVREDIERRGGSCGSFITIWSIYCFAFDFESRHQKYLKKKKEDDVDEIRHSESLRSAEARPIAVETRGNKCFLISSLSRA